MAYTVFISYAQKDKPYLDSLSNSLSNLMKQKLISTWHEEEIVPGTEWKQQIIDHLHTDDIILLLISNEFMASDFCYDVEMTQAIERHNAGQARVIPIIVRPTDWEDAPFAQLQVLPTKGKPISRWPKRDDALLDIVKGIKRAIKDLQERAANDHTYQPTQASYADNKGENGGSRTPFSASQSVPLNAVEQQQKDADRPNATSSISPSRSSTSLLATIAPAPPQAALSPIWSVPFPRNLYFTGRADILQQLRAALLKSKKASLTQTQVISGLGGIGKTQTALEYAYRHREDYRCTFWVRADTHELLTSDFAAMASALDLPVKDDKDQNLAVAAVKNWLQKNGDWLLIFDNADNLETAYKFLPQSAQGHSILTSREFASGRDIQNIPLEKMAREDAITFLLRQAKFIDIDATLENTSQENKDQAGEIVDTLGALPLALAQAGAYIERRQCGLPGYLDRYKLRSTQLLNEHAGLPADRKPVATTWSLSFEKVKENNPVAANLLRACAYLHPDAIPEEIMYLHTSKQDTHFQPIAEDIFALDDAIDELLKYSLIRRDKKTLTIHRLVQVILKESMDEQEQKRWASDILQLLNQALPEVKFETWPQCQRLLSHVQTCAALITQWELNVPAATHLLTEMGNYLTARGQYPDAASLLTQAMKIHEQRNNSDNLDVALTYNYLAELYREQGKYKEAEPLYERALALREQMLEDGHADIATSLNNLALLYYSQGRYKEAESLCQRALALRERVLGGEHPDVAMSLVNLALLYRAQGKYAEAEPLYQRALVLRERVLGGEHPDTATSLDNLATLYYNQKKYVEAESLCQRALALRERVLGGEHPDVAISLGNLATLYQTQGKYVEAEPLYLRTLALFERVLGEEHPKVATSLNNLALLYQHQGRYIHAKSLYQRALKMQEKLLGPKHPDVATTLNNLATFYAEQHHYTQAEPLIQRALSIYEQALGLEHPDTIKMLKSYVNILVGAKRSRKAAEIQARIDAIEKKVHEEHPEM